MTTLLDTTSITLNASAAATACECGCGLPAPRARQSDSKRGYVKGQVLRFRQGHGQRLRRGEHANRWCGGRFISDQGYVMVWAPEHVRASRGYVREHILIAERALGHALPELACVHHVDGGRSNNDRNLVVCEDQAYHMLLHKRQRALEACGDANAHRCKDCHTYERQSEITVCRSGITYHRDCAALRMKARRYGLPNPFAADDESEQTDALAGSE